MPKCKVCGTRLAEGVAKCPSCGAAAGSTVSGTVSPGTTLQKSVCPACNKQILGEHKYCPDCGADLKEAAAQCVHCGATLPEGSKFCVECGAQLDIAQTQQNLQTDDQFEHNSDKTSAQDFPQDEDEDEDEDDNDKKNINIAQRIIYYAAGIISFLGEFLYDILTAISFSKPDTRPTVAKVITRILIGIGDFIFLLGCYLGLKSLVEDKIGPITINYNTFQHMFMMVICLYPLYYLLLFIIRVLNLVPTVIYIFCSSKRLSFGNAYGKCIDHFAPVIGLLCSIFAYGVLIVVSILG